MTTFAGIGAGASVDSVAFTNASKWTLSVKNATKDVTPMGADGSFAVNIGTINSWTAKITAFLDNSDTAQTNLFALIGTIVEDLVLTVGSTHAFTGDAILSGIDPSVDAQDAETVDFSFTGTGPIAYA